VPSTCLFHYFDAKMFVGDNVDGDLCKTSNSHKLI